MDLRKKGFQLPKKLYFEEDSLTERYGRLVVDPLDRGFGVTLGNALRRVMLSSLEGAAVINIRIPGVLHEFDTVMGVHEDVVDIILNVKQLRLKAVGAGDRKMRIDAKTPGEIRAKDILTDGTVEILNPDLLIATLDKGASFEMEMTVRRGRGFIPAEQNKEEDWPVDVLAVDSIFSPIEMVNYDVEKARVGRSTDYDRLFMDIKTDGSMTPDEALTQAASILREHLDFFIMDGCGEDDDDAGLLDEDDGLADETPVFSENLLKTVDELELSVRSYNCLRNAEIRTISDLVQRTEQEMLKTKNFGRKSLTEIKAMLRGMGLRFGMRVDHEALQEALASRQNKGGEGGEA